MKQSIIQRLKIDLPLVAAALIASAIVLCADTSFAEIIGVIVKIP